MKFYFLLHWLILMAIAYLWLLITPLKLKVRIFRPLIPYFIHGHHLSKNGAGRKKKFDPVIDSKSPAYGDV